MRDILFRGKRKDNGEWVEGKGVDFNYDTPYIVTKEYNCGYGYFTGEYEVIPETVGQYTGLTDGTKWEQLTKEEQTDWLRNHTAEEWNGKKIFEGDIISVSFEEDRSPWESNCVYYDVHGKVYFDETLFGWYVKFQDDELSLWEYDDCGVTIIGNIHDNPELLEVEQ